MASIIKADTLQSTTANVFILNSSGTEYARFDSSGNMGIGTSSPGYKLDISTASASNGLGINLTNSGSTGAGINFLQSGVDSFFVSMPAGTGGLKFVASGTNERMRIDSSGNVGIGTTNPSRSKLVIGATTPQISFTDTDGTSNVVDITRIAGPGLTFSSNGTEVGRFDSAGLFKFNSGYGSVATAYGCRAWVNFNGTGAVAIRASGNVSSITDNGTGDYTVNFSTAMPDANYSVTAMCQYDNNGISADAVFLNVARRTGAIAAGSVRVGAFQSATLYDPIIATVTIFR